MHICIYPLLSRKHGEDMLNRHLKNHLPQKILRIPSVWLKQTNKQNKAFISIFLMFYLFRKLLN